MRQGKRFAALLLSLMLILAMSVSASAAGNGVITVDNPIKGVEYTAYKIFDAAYDTAGTHYSYTIEEGSEWFDTVKNYGNGLTLDPIADKCYAVVTDGTFSAPAFANALKTAAGSGKFSGVRLADVGSVKTASGLELGYYFVMSSSGALCNLTTTDPTVTIHDKNDVPFEKTDDESSVEIGQKVNYKITGKVPDATGFKKYTYTISDSMSEGLTFQKDVKVKIGGADVTKECGVTDTADGFTLTIPVMKYQDQVGAEISVEYSAVVNERAIAKVEKNTATLTYSNDPTDETSTDDLTDEEDVYSAQIVIDKYEAKPANDKDDSTKLADAKFVLYKEDTQGGANDKQYYKNEANKVEWVKDIKEATEVKTDDKGAAQINGLKDGIYYLLETEAPKGYNPLKDPLRIEIKGTDDNGKVDTSKLSYTAKVANKTGAELPSTGGIGTTGFYAVGGALVLAAVVLLVTKRRMDTEK